MVVFLPSPHYTLPSTPTAKENIQQAAMDLGQRLIGMAMNNPAHHELGQHAGLQQLSDINETGTRKLEAAGVTIPPTPRVETEPDTRVRDPVFNKPTPRECTNILRDIAAPIHCTLQCHPTNNGSPVSEGEGNRTRKIEKTQRSVNWKQKKQCQEYIQRTNPMSH